MYDKEQSKLEKEILETSGLAKKTDYSTKIANVESKTPDVSGLATKAALNNVETENNLNNQNHDKYITTPEFNTLAADAFNTILARSNLVKKTHILMLYCQVLT